MQQSGLKDKTNSTEEVNWRLDIFDNMNLDLVDGNAGGRATRSISISNNSSSSTSNAIVNTGVENFETAAITGNGEELTEDEIAAFIRSEQEAARDGNNADVSSKYTPQIGLEFKSREDAHRFFNFYGMLAGFEPVTTHVGRTTSKKRNGEIFKFEMKCNMHGTEPKRKTEAQLAEEALDASRVTKGAKRKTNVPIKTNCPVVMAVKEANGIWKITRLNLDHNHQLCPENSGQLFSGRKYMTDMEKRLIRTLNATNMETRKMIAILSYLRGGMNALPYKKYGGKVLHQGQFAEGKHCFTSSRPKKSIGKSIDAGARDQVLLDFTKKRPWIAAMEGAHDGDGDGLESAVRGDEYQRRGLEIESLQGKEKPTSQFMHEFGQQQLVDKEDLQYRGQNKRSRQIIAYGRNGLDIKHTQDPQYEPDVSHRDENELKQSDGQATSRSVAAGDDSNRGRLRKSDAANPVPRIEETMSECLALRKEQSVAKMHGKMTGDEYSMTRCLAVLRDTDDVSDEIRIHASDIFKDALNREIFLGYEPRLRGLWLKKEVYKLGIQFNLHDP